MLYIVVSLISGILLSLAFPRANMHWLAWFALAPLMYYVYRLTWKRALICGLAFGVGFFASLLYWIAIFGKLPWVLLSILQALFVVGFVVLAKLIGSRLGLWGRFMLLPALWLAFEWFRSLGMLGFTWGDMGYSQYKVLPVIQIASLAGVWGVSLLVALSNAAFANLATARKAGRGFGAAYMQVFLVGLLVLAAAIYGQASVGRRNAPAGERVKAAVVQGNVNQDTDQDVEYCEHVWHTYRTMTLAAAQKGADFIVWPETVVPGCAGSEATIQRRLSSLAAEAGGYLLVGGSDEDEEGRMYNSAFLIGPGRGVLGRYAKVHLVPFGEFVPARRYIPFLGHYRVTPYDTSPGPGYGPLDTGRYQLGMAICFESIFPHISRRFSLSGAELLCVITNDAWFGRTAAAEQHMAKSVFRAVENHRYLIRAAATGISCIIDPRGRILAQCGLFQPGVLVHDVWTDTDRTFYVAHGNWLVYVCLVAIFLLAIVASLRRPE